MNFQKGRHYNKEIEDSVIGQLLLEPDAISRIQGLVEPEHFYFKENQKIYEVISEMWSDGMLIDVISVVHEIYNRRLENEFSGNPSYELTVKTNSIMEAAFIEQHSLFLRQMAARRMRIIIQQEADKDVDDDLEKTQELIERFNSIITVNDNDDWHDLSQVMLSVTRHMEEVRGKDMLGIHTGFRELDRWTMGYQPGQLVVIAARPSVGKSAFVSGMAITAAKEGKTVGIINLEMPEEQVGARLASFYSDTEFWRIYTANMKSDADEQRLYDQMSDLSHLPIYVSDKTNVSVSDIRSKANKLRKRRGLDMLIIDYLQLIESDGKKSDTREREVAKMSRGLKLLAKNLKIPVVILCQLNRETAKNHGQKPRLHNIRESGAIEQDADVVMLLHSDFKAGKDFNEQGESTENCRTIIVEKNRNGRTGEIETGFSPETMKFYDLEDGRNADKAIDWIDYTEPNSAVQEDEPF